MKNIISIDKTYRALVVIKAADSWTPNTLKTTLKIYAQEDDFAN